MNKLLLTLGLILTSLSAHAAGSYVAVPGSGDNVGGYSLQRQSDNYKAWVLDARGAVRISPMVEQKDDFMGPTLNSNLWTAIGGTTSGGSPTITVSTSGIVSMTTGLSNTDGAGNSELTASKNWVANQGSLFIEARLKLPVSTSEIVAVGFLDQVTTTVPVVISGTTTSTYVVTAGTPNFVGLVYSPSSTISITTAGLPRWMGVGVRDTVTSTAVIAGPNVTPSTFVTVRANVHTNGSADFYVDGKSFGSLPAGSVNSATALAPIVGIDTNDATAHNLLLDYVQVGQKR